MLVACTADGAAMSTKVVWPSHVRLTMERGSLIGSWTPAGLSWHHSSASPLAWKRHIHLSLAVSTIHPTQSLALANDISNRRQPATQYKTPHTSCKRSARQPYTSSLNPVIKETITQWRLREAPAISSHFDSTQPVALGFVPCIYFEIHVGIATKLLYRRFPSRHSVLIYFTEVASSRNQWCDDCFKKYSNRMGLYNA